MPSFMCLRSQEDGNEHSASQTDRHVKGSVLPPFTGILGVDDKLKLSNKNFKQSIHDSFNDRHITATSQLATTPPFPTPYVLAQFASKAYTDYKRGETDAQYETRLELPEGWKLLTTASNTRRSNGYFGAACWHPEHQHVVIAHRGTDPSNIGALYTDFIGVLFKRHVPQMSSASTFAYEVVKMLREINTERGTIFQIFYTGHSLGGWLAQITTFTTEYLKKIENFFLKRDSDQDYFHPHTIVFDSPGCEEMLTQMRSTFDVRHEGRSIVLEHLDITSYLSAPNRINTCNAHLGTVYRIFVVLSDMSWWEKKTALYNLSTHSMDRIVKVFECKTGQKATDRNGELRILLVVDWPISAGLSRSKEYRQFFEWAKHFNNYHPESTCEVYQREGYSHIRYQTTAYDERVTSVRVFSQEELQFLQDYRQICQLPEFFKPEEILPASSNNEERNEAEQELQNFVLENKTIHCKNASALHQLIPYVKRLLQLYPQVKENTKCALSPHEIRNNVYQIGTKRLLNMFEGSQLEFEHDALKLGDFLNSANQNALQLQMTNVDAWTGLVMVYQVLRNTNCLSEGHYTILTLEHLLSVNEMVDLNTLILSTTAPHLLVMSCETKQLPNEQTEQTFKTLFDTLKDKPSFKIIFTINAKDSTVNFLQEIANESLISGFLTRNEKLNLCDLTRRSQENLLAKSVNFQGSSVALNALITADSPVAELLPLGALLEEKQLSIGKPVPVSDAYNESYYIGRTFNHLIAITQGIFIEEAENRFPDLLAKSKQEFVQLCQLNTEGNVHWLERDTSGDIVWQQSQGSVAALRKYIDTDRQHTYTPVELDKLLDKAKQQRVMLISDTAGMGKSTVLTHLSKQIKEKFPAKWVSRIDLNDHTDALRALKGEQIDKEKAVTFVSEKLLKLEPGLELELFKECLEKEEMMKVVIMLDGFDEISPYYKETVLGLLQALKQTSVEQLWVTTRPHLREELEVNLRQICYTLEPFTEENQVEFLKKFWRQKNWFTEALKEDNEDKTEKLEVYAKELIKKLGTSISDKQKEFTGIPLQCRMLAEAFDEAVKTFCDSDESMPKLPHKLELIGLYRLFVDRKYGIYEEEKSRRVGSNVVAIWQTERDRECMREDHQLLALKVLLTEEQVRLLNPKRQCTLADEELTRIGLVHVNDEDKLHFIHRTFAEYFVAEYLVDILRKENGSSLQTRDLLLKYIFLGEDYEVIRCFMDGLLPECAPLEGILRLYGNWIHESERDGLLLLHQAASEGNAHIIEFLLHSLKVSGHTDTVNKLLIGRNSEHNTAWFLSAKNGNVQAMEKLWDWSVENMDQEVLKRKLLYFTNPWGETAWSIATALGRAEVLEKIWQKAKSVMTIDELKKEMLFARNTRKQTIFQVAATEGKGRVLQMLWGWAQETLTAEEMKNNLLFASHVYGGTVWHDAAGLNEIELLEKIWQWSKNELTSEELKNELLLATDGSKRTAWHVAVQNGKMDLLQKLWQWSKNELTSEELKNELLLATDGSKRTAWHVAVQNGKMHLLQKLWEWAKDELSAEELNNELLLATDDKKQTAFHLAAKSGNTEALQKLWEWAKEKLNIDDLNDKLFLAADENKETACHMAAREGNTEVLQKLWELANDNLTSEQLNDKFLLATNYTKQNAFHVAAEWGNTEALLKLWEWAKEKLASDKLKKFLLATDGTKQTAFHVAAREGNTAALEKLWELANDNLTPEHLNDKFLLATDDKEQTAFHVAAWLGKTVTLQKLWEWAKEKLASDKLKKFLLATDGTKQTAFHVAAKMSNTEAFLKLWEWAKEKLTAEELKYKWLLAKDVLGDTVWHKAAEIKSSELLEKLWEWAQENLTAEELKNELLLARNNSKKTAFHVAAREGKPNMLHTLWKCTKENTVTEDISKYLLLAKNSTDETAWHVAAERRNTAAVAQIWKLAEETLTIEEIKNEFLLAKNTYGRTVWHSVILLGDLQLLQKLWQLAQEKLPPGDLNKILLAKDEKKRTALRAAIPSHNREMSQKLWVWAKQKLTREELGDKLLLDKDLVGNTAWHDAARVGDLKLLVMFWEWAKENLTAEELKIKVLLAKDDKRQTPWHVAARMGRTGALQLLWDWTKEQLTPEELGNELLLAKIDREEKVWYEAAMTGNVALLEELWDCAKSKLKSDQLCYAILMAEDDSEQTAFHMAAEGGKTEVLEMLREWNKETLTAEGLSKELLDKDEFHVTEERWKIDLLQTLQDAAEEKLTTEELRNKLLSNHLWRNTAWQRAALLSESELLEKLWQWFKRTPARGLCLKDFLLSHRSEQTHLDVETETVMQ